MTRYAFLIGINEYKEWSPLSAPAGESGRFGDLLKDYGDFEIIYPKSKDKEKLLTEIEEFCQEKTAEDILLLYFSGHGEVFGQKKDTKRFHFITHNTRKETPVTSSIQGLMVKNLLEDSHTKAQIVILDCCHSEAFIKGQDVAEEINQELNAAKGFFFLASSLDWQKSSENGNLPLNERKSFFTETIIEGIIKGEADTESKGIITFNMLKDYVCENIKKKTRKQTPVGANKSRGVLELVRNPHSNILRELNCWVEEDFETKKKCEFWVKTARESIDEGDFEDAGKLLEKAKKVCWDVLLDSNLLSEIRELQKKIPSKENGILRPELEVREGEIIPFGITSVFLCYSYSDETIVEQFIEPYRALGLRVNSANSVLSKGRWSEQLVKMIERSDKFLLFWSTSSRNSKAVQTELEYALKLSKQKRERFFCPIYWESPMPEPPEELRDLHFYKLRTKIIKLT